MAARTLTVNILGNADQAKQALGGISENADTAGSRVASFGKKAGIAAAGGIAALGGALVGAALKTANHADEIAKAARQAGISGEAYQELEYALGQAGIETGTMTRLLDRNNQRLGRAQQGNEKLQGAYADLGVSIHDTNGEARNSEEVFDDVMVALAGIEDPAERAALAGELLGTKAGRELAGALDGGIDSINEARDRAHDLGIVMGEDTLESAEAFNDGMDDIKRAMTGMVTQVGAEVLPALLPLVETFAENLPGALEKVSGFFQDRVLPAFQDVIGWIVPKVQQLADLFMDHALPAIQGFGEGGSGFLTGTLLPAAQDFWGWLQPKIMALAEWFMDTALPAIQDFADSARDLFLDTLLPAAQDFWNWLSPKISDLVSWFMDDALPAIQDFAESARDFIQETILPALEQFMDWLFPKIQELGEWFTETAIPAVSDFADTATGAFENVRDVVEPILEKIMDRLGEFADKVLPEVVAAWESIEENVPRVVNYIWEDIIKPVFDSIQGFIEDHSDTIETVLTGAWDFIEETIGNAIDIIEGIILTALKLIQGDWEGAWEEIKGVGESLWRQIRNVITTAARLLRGILGRIWDQIADKASSVWEWIKRTLDRLAGEVKDVVLAPIRSARNLLNIIWNTIQRKAETTWDAIKDFIDDGYSAMVRVLRAPFDWFTDTFNWDNISDTATAAWDKIQTYINRGKQAMIDVLKAPFEWLRDNVGGIMRGAANFAIDQANNMLGGMETMLGGLISAINWVGDKLSIDTLADLSAPELPRIDPIPAFAKGGTMGVGGMALVGEEGPELVHLPGGATVIPADQTAKAMQGVDGPMSDMGKRGVGGGCMMCAMGLHDHDGSEPEGVGWGRVGDIASGAWDGISDAAGWVAGLPGEVLDWIKEGAQAALAEVLDRFPLELELPGIFASLADSLLPMIRDGLLNLLSNLFSDAEEEMAPDGGQSPVSLGGWHQPTVGTRTQGFGHTEFSRSSGWYGPGGHTGIDIANSSGTPIWAANDGNVSTAGWQGGYGNTVILQHADALSTLYAHMRRILVSVGQMVAGGNQIGEMGTTGASTGDHLHFELRQNGNPINPLGTVPGLATGGIVTKPMFAMIGEAGPEAVIPLDRAGKQQPMEVHLHHTSVLELDGRKLAERTYQDIFDLIESSGELTSGVRRTLRSEQEREF